MISIKKSETRGQTNIRWLKSKHSFSFGSYYDAKAMGVSALRVINEDHVLPGEGFATHGHRDMEILTFVLEGNIAHKDSEGNIQTLPAGEFQLMSAGSGIQHSEYNPSSVEPLRFLQIWIQPNVFGQTPGYQQKGFGKAPGATLIASADGNNESMRLKQDANIYQLALPEQKEYVFATDERRQYYVHVIEGLLRLDEETTLQAGDAATLNKIDQINFASQNGQVLALIFDLP